MLKVMLVDDEPFILQGLSVLIDWKGLGYEIVKSASNGLEALEYLREAPVDLILADVKMPGMTGIELLKRVRSEKAEEVYFAFLSGYQDFEYTRAALCNSCVDYILKPVSRKELTELLERVRRLHAKDARQRMEAERQEKALFARNLISILRGKYDSINLQYVRERLCARGCMRYVGIEIDGRSPDAARLTDGEMRQWQRQLYQTGLELMGERGYHCIFDVHWQESRYDVGLIYSDDMAEAAGLSEQEYLDGLLEKIRRKMAVPVIMLVGSRVKELSALSDSFRSVAVVRSFQDFRLSAGNGTAAGNAMCKKTLDALLTAVEQNEKESIGASVERLYEEMNGGGMDAELVHVNINYLLFGLVHLATLQAENVDQEEILRFIAGNAFDEGTIRGSSRHLTHFACEYADYLAQLRSKGTRGILAEIEREVRNRYAENLTLKELSRKYYVNTAYLGQVFRKNYGISFKDYLNNCRMERAAELLMHSDMKISEIAERVGYHDMDYFIDRFVVAKGCTPARFRKRLLEEE